MSAGKRTKADVNRLWYVFDSEQNELAICFDWFFFIEDSKSRRRFTLIEFRGSVRPANAVKTRKQCNGRGDNLPNFKAMGVEIFV